MAYIVETRGRTLEETAVLFDGEEPTADLAQMGGDAAMTGADRTNNIVVEVSVEKDEHRVDYMELRDVSVAGSSAEDLSGHHPMEVEPKDRRRLHRIDEDA